MTVWIVLIASITVIVGVAVYGIKLLVGSYNALKQQRNAFYLAEAECQGISTPKASWNVPSDTIVGRWIQICQKRFAKDLTTPLDMLQELSDSILEKSDNLIRTIISALIVIGLLGTFIGLVIAVSNTFSIVQEVQQSTHQLANPQAEEMSISEAVQKQFNAFLDNLKPVLGGMSLAFITSIVGLTFSLGLGYCFARYSQAREEFRANLVQFADAELLPLFTPPSEKYTIGRVIQDSLTEIQQKFDDTNQANREHLEKALQDASQQNKDALSNVSEMMKKTVDETTEAMQNNYQKLSVVMANLTKQHIQKNRELLEEIMGQLKDTIEENAKFTSEESQKVLGNMGSVIEAFNETSNKLSENFQRLDGLSQKMDNSSEQFMQSVQVFSRYIKNFSNFNRPIEQLNEFIDALITIIQMNDPKDRYNRQVFENMLTTLIGLSTQVDGFRREVEGGSQKSHAIVSDISGQITEVNKDISNMHTDVSGLLTSEDATLHKMSSQLQHQSNVGDKMEEQYIEFFGVLRDLQTQMNNQLQEIKQEISALDLSVEVHPIAEEQPFKALEIQLTSINSGVEALVEEISQQRSQPVVMLKRRQPVTIRSILRHIKNFFIG